MRMTVTVLSLNVASVSTKLPANTAFKLTGFEAVQARIWCFMNVVSAYKNSETSSASTTTGNLLMDAGVGKGKSEVRSNPQIKIAIPIPPTIRVHARR